MDSLEALTFCLEQGYPAPVTAAFLALLEDEDLLEDAWRAWDKWYRDMTCNGVDCHHATRRPDFTAAVDEVTDDECRFCDDCGGITWVDAMTIVGNGDYVCDDGCLEGYGYCTGCEEYWASSRITDVRGEGYCRDCLNSDFTYCHDCEEYFPDDEGHEHEEDDESCDCRPPVPRFTFPANGHGVVEQNERLTVELPKGVIDDEGMLRIQNLLYQTLPYYVVDPALEEVGHHWQLKRGNFTRRLSAVLHKHFEVKLEPGTISEVGNLARAHSSEGALWHVEFTRDVNESAEAFYHAGSCWWGSHSTSRCCLKSWGGLGLRSYASVDDYSYRPNGRAWVQPLNEQLRPTHDALNAHAYVVFNGYGRLEGYAPARIVSHLASRTYRKIELCSDNQYINNDTGYLIADEATCNGTTSLYFDYDEHDERDAEQVIKASRKEVAA